MASAYEHLRADFAECGSLIFTNGSGSLIDGGTLRVEGATLGMVLDPVDDTEDGVLLTRVPAPGISLPKASGVSFAVGAVAYYDVADGEVNDDDTNSACGRVLQAAAGGDARVVVELTNEEPIA